MSGFQRVAILCLVIFTGLLVACTEPDSKASREPVSYTHLTLPTICSV